VAALRTENSRLGAATESAAAQRAELTDLKAKLAEAQKTAEQQGARVAELSGANDKFGANLKELEGQLATLRAENVRLGQSDQARAEAEQRASTLATASTQLAAVQKDLAASRAENTRLADSLQAIERDRVARVTQLQQENAAITARLRQAQGTLDQIASAARLINGGGGLVGWCNGADDRHANAGGSGGGPHARGAGRGFADAHQQPLLRDDGALAGNLRGEPGNAERRERPPAGTAPQDPVSGKARRRMTAAQGRAP
jgi:hypothetical protein